MAAALAALEALADAPPTSYLKRPQGETVLRQLYEQAATAQLVPADAADDIARLHGLFDVALEHGIGGLVCDYIAEVCCDRQLTSSDPVEAYLQDGECVRRWAATKLTISQGRLAGWLSRGLSSLASSGVVPKELSKLRVLQLVFRALAQPSQPAAAAAQQQQQLQLGGTASASGGTLSTSAAEPAPLPELIEAERLLQCAHVAAWLSHQPLRFERPSGRYSSEQEWRSAAAKRRDAAGLQGLFLADLLSSLARHGVAGLTYPASSTDKLLSALFLAGGTGPEALRAKLALLSYHLLDGGFLPAEAIAEGLRHEFGVPRDTAHAWLLQQLLDGSRGEAGAGPCLQAAVGLAPAVDGASLPSKAAAAFGELGRPDVALRLLRQRAPGGATSASSSSSSSSLDAASAALGARLANGLLVEGYMVLEAHQAAVLPAQRAAHAAALVRQLMDWAAEQGCLHSVIRLHFEGPGEEALVGWLEGAADGGQERYGLLLTLYYLTRGRIPEALLAYNRLCPSPPASEEQEHVAALLREATRMLPAPQRALVVRRGGASALLLPADAADGGAPGEGGEGEALLARMPELAVEGTPRLVAVGETLAGAPLVGSVPVLVAQQAAGEAARMEEEAAGGGAAVAAAAAAQPAGVARLAAGAMLPAPTQPKPLLFGGQQDAGGMQVQAAVSAFGTAQASAPERTAGNHGLLSGAAEFDLVLGVGAAKGKRRRQPAFR